MAVLGQQGGWGWPSECRNGGDAEEDAGTPNHNLSPTLSHDDFNTPVPHPTDFPNHNKSVEDKA